MSPFGIFALVCSAAALRSRRRSESWSTTADRANGPCAPHLARGVSAVVGGEDNLPVAMPLICTGAATEVTVTATAFGHTNANLKFKFNGQEKGSISFPWWETGREKTLSLSLGDLASGLHSVQFSGEKIDFKSVTLSGTGGSCSLDEAPGWNAAKSSGTSASLDALNQLFPPIREFPPAAKKQLYFSMETVGKTDDGEISSTVVADGFWNWMLSYSQNPNQKDSWGGDTDNLWNESKNYPPVNISLGRVPGRTGQAMTIYEPCNTLSNIAFHEVAVWASCKAYPFTREESASLVSALNSLSAGSSFLHACGCNIGNRTDTFTIDWFLLQAYQIMVKEAVSGAGDALTVDEKNALFSLVPAGTAPVSAIDVAKDITRLFRGKYDRDFFAEVMYGYKIPKYLTAIGGLIAFTVYALKTNSLLPALLEPIIDEVLKILIDQFFAEEELKPVAEWLKTTYNPIAKKSWDLVKLCRATYIGVDPLLESFVKFAVTFIESLIYQENTIVAPDILRKLLGALESLGANSELLNNLDRTWEIYNGHDCHARSDHAIWHFRAGHGFLHLMDMAEILVTRTKKDMSEC